MAASNIAEFLAINNAGTSDALALKVWSGMVLGAFNQTTVTAGRYIERMIASGKSAQFPVLGRSTTEFHTPGAEISFDDWGSNERVIAIDGLLLAKHFIDVLDEAKSHFDIRSEIATAMGAQLAEAHDQRVLMAYISASRASGANVTAPAGQTTPAPQRVTGATIGTDAAVLKAGVYAAAEDLDNAYVPAEDRAFFVAPPQFYLLLQDGEFIDRDFNDGSNGSRSAAVMRNASDFEVVKTTNLPRADLSASSDTLADELENDYSTNIAVCGHRSAAGSVSLIGPSFETAWDSLRQGYRLISKYARGYNYLRPESSVELATS